MNYDDPQAIWEGLAVCQTHMAMPKQDCADCDAEMVARSAVIDQIAAEAGDRMQGLARAGVSSPHLSMLAIRVEVLIDTLQLDPRQRFQFEGECARRTMQMIKAMQAEVTKQTLAPQQGLTVVRGGKKP